MSKEQKILKSFRCPSELAKRLKVYCAYNEISEQDAITNAIKEYLNKHSTTKNKNM